MLKNCPFCEKILDDVALLTNICSSCKEILGDINHTMRTIRIAQFANNPPPLVETPPPAKTVCDKIATEKNKPVELVINLRRMAPGKSAALNIAADYQFTAQLGVGGMGVVHEARQNSLGRLVAVKLLNDNSTNNAQAFTREAAVIGNLEHPNIVPIYELGKNDAGQPFYAMKRVRGASWAHEIENKSLPENIEILLKVCDAVAYAHSRGIIHRDLKPENVMLGEFGEVLLMDWGLAAGMTDGLPAPRVRYEDAIAGTPSYMAPEMARGEENIIGFASDIYLLGAILFEIVTGEQPHHGKNIRDCLDNAAQNKIVDAWIDSQLLATAKKAMTSEPEARFADVRALQASIRQQASSVIAATRARQARTRAHQTGSYFDYFQATGGFLESSGEDNAAVARELQELAQEFADLAQKNGDHHLAKTLRDKGAQLR